MHDRSISKIEEKIIEEQAELLKTFTLVDK